MKKIGFASIVLVITVVLFSACGKKINFAVSPVVPAAKGVVKVKKDKNNNYALDISVLNLAEPKNLTPSKDHYVVWLETESNGSKNLGRISTSSGLFSSSLKASLHAVTTFKPKYIFITAENNDVGQYPGNMIVLRSNDF